MAMTIQISLKRDSDNTYVHAANLDVRAVDRQYVSLTLENPRRAVIVDRNELQRALAAVEE